MATIRFFNIAILGLCAIFVCGTQAVEEPGVYCPTFWTPFGDSCYRIIAKPETWGDAEAKCQQLGSDVPNLEGHLVSIHSQEENNFAQEYFESSVIFYGKRAYSKHNALWLGLHKKESQLETFAWSDGSEVSFTFWKSMDTARSNRCGYMLPVSTKPAFQGKWADTNCTRKMPFMCKLVPVDQQDTGLDEGSMSWSSSAGLLPCSYRGQLILHGEVQNIDGCTDCGCNNSTVECSRRLCPPTPCEEPVRSEGECCGTCPQGTPDEGGDQDYSSFNCSYEHLKLLENDCTACRCGADNSTIRCDIRSCQPLFCKNSVRLEGECCDFCPYDVPIYGVDFLGVKSVNAGDVTSIRVDLQLAVNEFGLDAEGTGLWEVSMWASANPDGSGNKTGFIKQVLTDDQASRQLNRPPRYGGFEFSIPDINFALDASDASCEELAYLCGSFSMGDAPKPKDSRIPFNVYGVEAESDSTPNASRLVGCKEFSKCKGRRRDSGIHRA